MQKSLEEFKGEIALSPYYQSEDIRAKIDELLRKNASLECHLGKDSTIKERVNAKIKQERIFELIKDLDLEYYKIIIPDHDLS